MFELIIILGLTIVYAHVLYPGVMVVLHRVVGSSESESSQGEPVSDDTLPDVTVILAAFNEEKDIGKRLRNLLEQDYPPQKLRIMVGSDGSSDQTVEEVKSIDDQRIALFDFTENRGKAVVLNELVDRAKTEILVFSDANTYFDAKTIRALVEPMKNLEIGCVCGELRVSDAGAETSEGRLWSMESRLKAAESRFDALLGANGAVYAIRKSLYRPVPRDVVIDDFVIAMNVAVQGARVLFRSAARAYEVSSSNAEGEYSRRVRIGVGNYRTLFRYPEYFWKGGFRRGIAYVSHKVLRWATPHIAMLILALSFAGRADSGVFLLLVLQVLGYTALVALFLVRRRWGMPSIIRAGIYFAMLNLALLHGFLLYALGGLKSGSWNRSQR